MSHFPTFRIGSRVGMVRATRARALHLKVRHRAPKHRSSTGLDSGSRRGIVPLGQFPWENPNG